MCKETWLLAWWSDRADLVDGDGDGDRDGNRGVSQC
jgi:hypothetical protein